MDHVDESSVKQMPPEYYQHVNDALSGKPLDANHIAVVRNVSMKLSLG